MKKIFHQSIHHEDDGLSLIETREIIQILKRAKETNNIVTLRCRKGEHTIALLTSMEKVLKIRQDDYPNRDFN